MSQPHATTTVLENNHWVTTTMVTIVHPKTDDPRDVATFVAGALVDAGIPDSWGEGPVVSAGSVGTYIPLDDASLEAGRDNPDWHQQG